MPHPSHPELEGETPQTLYSFELKRPGQTLRERFAVGLFGLALGLGGATAFFISADTIPWPLFQPRVSQPAPASPPTIQQGLNHAMAAAELTQSASFREEWVEVVLLWQQAIAHMQAVAKPDPDYAMAQEKVIEYSRNLQYAQSNVETRASRSPSPQNYWTLGSDRDWVIALQGPPSQVRRYDSSCREVLSYGGSVIELQNGYVNQYSNLDGNLRVLADVPMVQSTQGSRDQWGLGASRARVLELQGIPTRIEHYASDHRVTLHYGNSSVLIEGDHAISYLNADQNLRVSTAVAGATTSGEAWSIGSSRGQVLQAQGQPPRAISRSDSRCEEVFYYGNSEVILRQGFVIGYRGEGSELRVR